MQNKRKKFIAVVIFFIISIIGFEVYKAFLAYGIDRNSYVILNTGKAKLNTKNLIINKKEKLKAQDKIETIGKNSLVIIKWGDGSITRLGGNSVLVVKENQVDKNLLNIKIAFFLEKGKTWSDVISFIGEGSYFHQSFADTTAAVRGTIFEVNLEKDYVYVEKHEVKLTKKSGETKIIPEKKPFLISKFSFIELLNFIKNIKDTAWQQLNIKLDKEFYNKLKRNIEKINRQIEKNIIKYQEEIKNFNNLSQEKKEELYNNLLSEYQKIKFISPNDNKIYQTKLKLKEELLAISDSKNKKNLLITTIYDIKDLSFNKDIKNLGKSLEILVKNKDLLDGLNINFKNYIDLKYLKDLKIPDNLKNSFYKNLNLIKNKFNLSEIDNSLQNSFEKIKENIGNLKNITNEN